MKKASFFKALTSLAATAVIAAAAIPASAGAAWKKVCTLGDLNLDSQVNVADIVTIVNRIQNGDSTVSAKDITTIVNKMLGK